jgi:hypothetical protein
VRVYEFEDREPRAQAVAPRLGSSVKTMGAVGEGNWLRDVQGSTDSGNVRLSLCLVPGITLRVPLSENRRGDCWAQKNQQVNRNQSMTNIFIAI